MPLLVQDTETGLNGIMISIIIRLKNGLLLFKNGILKLWLRKVQLRIFRGDLQGLSVSKYLISGKGYFNF